MLLLQFCNKEKRGSMPRFSFILFGAGDVTRTHDLLITNQLHYRLCYTSDLNIIIQKSGFVKDFLR